MKVAAHPLVVAVALGLLGPSVLSESSDDRPESRSARSIEAPSLPTHLLDLDHVMGASQSDAAVVVGVSALPEAHELERVETAWLQARQLLDSV